MSAIEITPGFSTLNRGILYASFLLSPAQFASGLGNHCPSNIGFLAYNIYTQISWYQASKEGDMHALSLVLVHVNMVFAITYLGGVSSGNIFMGILLGLGSAAVIGLNTATAWNAYRALPEGFGEYQFFFFGWRTLTPEWYKFILLWQIEDSITAFVCGIAAIVIPIVLFGFDEGRTKISSVIKYAAIPVGGAVALLVGWPLILWIELIMARNNLQSDTDMIAVWLFIAQVGTLVLPSSRTFLGCLKRVT